MDALKALAVVDGGVNITSSNGSDQHAEMIAQAEQLGQCAISVAYGSEEWLPIVVELSTLVASMDVEPQLSLAQADLATFHVDGQQPMMSWFMILIS